MFAAFACGVAGTLLLLAVARQALPPAAGRGWVAALGGALLPGTASCAAVPVLGMAFGVLCCNLLLHCAERGAKPWCLWPLLGCLLASVVDSDGNLERAVDGLLAAAVAGLMTVAETRLRRLRPAFALHALALPLTALLGLAALHGAFACVP